MANDKIYQDEPIIYRPGRFVQKDRRPAGAAAPCGQPENTLQTPEKIIEMRRLAYTSEAIGKSREWLFLQQARFMAEYEDDDAQPVHFDRYYPTYADMTNAELRAYFTWRTSVRKGDFPDVCLSFLYVYLYELIAGVGCEDAEDGFRKFCAVKEHYQFLSVFPKIRLNLETWMRDYVLFYGLDPALLRGSQEERYEEAVVILMHDAEQPDETLFGALQTLSSYKTERSVILKKHRDAYCKAACMTFRMMAENYRLHGNVSYCEEIFGRMTEVQFSVFRNAVFYHERRPDDRHIAVNEIHHYHVRHGVWFCKRYFGRLHQNIHIGALLRAVDFAMRTRTGLKPLTPPKMTKLLSDTVQKALDAVEAEQRELERPVINIDLSRLSDIRAAADVTREKLLVEEEERLKPEPVAPQPEPVQDVPEPTSDLPLAPEEYRFLQALLYGGDWRQAAKDAGKLPSVLTEAVNEKLFDRFGDTVIDDACDVPELIEDYTDELKGMIQP
ncbi:MAG: TerB N-terminal domain-containing protein [Oscillospiraceae bacterium]|nr:TerB N-terminal domain-containing protein [Oscillospiraceae bacterium]